MIYTLLFCLLNIGIYLLKLIMVLREGMQIFLNKATTSIMKFFLVRFFNT